MITIARAHCGGLAAMSSRPSPQYVGSESSATRSKEDSMGRLCGRTLGVCGTIVALVLASSALAAAQAVKGSLLGSVSDASGSVLPGVTVTITEVNTNISYSAVSNQSGYYMFSNLKDGTYRVVSELTGFKRVVRDGVEVPVNTTVRVDLKME